jgi:hypothetical protein
MFLGSRQYLITVLDATVQWSALARLNVYAPLAFKDGNLQNPEQNIKLHQIRNLNSPQIAVYAVQDCKVTSAIKSTRQDVHLHAC